MSSHITMPPKHIPATAGKKTKELFIGTFPKKLYDYSVKK